MASFQKVQSLLNSVGRMRDIKKLQNISKCIFVHLLIALHLSQVMPIFAKKNNNK